MSAQMWPLQLKVVLRPDRAEATDKKQRNIQRQWSIDLKKIDLQIQQAIKEQDRKYANELWEKRQELNEQKRIDIRNEKRAWKEHISKKYKDEDPQNLKKNQKKPGIFHRFFNFFGNN